MSPTTIMLCTSLVAIGAGCMGAQTPTADAPGHRVEIRVAPLSLPQVTDADFTITVTNEADPPAVVWTAGGLTSDRYGDGEGALTYVGPCDGSTPMNTVTLTLNALYQEVAGVRAEIPSSTWRNPTPVSMRVPCNPNEDTLVPFDLVIMRGAEQGFFDIAVTFEDLFCSAKLDCNPRMLFDGDTRALTFIAGFACTSGQGEITWLYLDDFVLECTDDAWATVAASVTIDPDQGVGQHGPLDGALFEHATYFGQEAFTDVDKCYWNNAFGVELAWLQAHAECRIRGRGTAATALWAAQTSPAHTAYPMVAWQTTVWRAGGLVCENHPLDGTPAGVATAYTDLTLDAGTPFAHAEPCSRDVIACRVDDHDVVVEGNPGARRVTITAGAGGAGVSGSFDLPADMTLVSVDDCCPSCCQ